MADQASDVDSSDHRNNLDSPANGGLNVLLLHDLPEYLTYRAIHDLVKPYGDVVRIRLTRNGNYPSNWCYVVCAMAVEARSALQAVG